jgi:hypothetical protein
MLYVHVVCPFCMSILMSMLHVRAACSCSMPCLHVNVHPACLLYRSISQVYSECQCCMFILMFVLHVYVYMLHVHSACQCCLSMLYVLAACQCCVSMLHVLTSCPRPHAACPCCMNHLQEHEHGHAY